MNTPARTAAALLALVVSPFAAAGEPDRAAIDVDPVSVDLSRAYAQPENPDTAEASAADPTAARDAEDQDAFARAGSDWLNVGGGVANDFRGDTDLNLHVSYTTFLADRFEWGVELGGWYFHQSGDDTEGLSGSLLFRWHFWASDDHRWTVFTDAGIGVLAAFDDVPDGGTSLNFLPRAGFGFTRAFNESADGESRGPRVLAGVRWHHISNARIEGDGHNPARDGVMAYAEVMIPF